MLYETTWTPPLNEYAATFSRRQASTVLLDAVGQRNALQVTEQCNELLYGLSLIKRLSPSYSWNEEVQYIRDHPAFEYMLRAPLNGRSVLKPRGYAGDAVTIDLLYGIETVDDNDPWVQAVHAWLRTAPACRAVNARREAIAAAVEDAGKKKPGAAVFSIACGHVRELELVGAGALKNIGRVVCLDQDGESLATARRDYPNAPLELIEGSVREILRGKISFKGEFDLIYTAGLYDYLEERVARALTARLTEMLAPGGRLLVANFATNLPDIGYMEAFMDWKLIYRTEADMLNLAPKQSEGDTVSVSRLASPNLVWLDYVTASSIKPKTAVVSG